MNLTGSTAIISGGLGDIARAMALAFARAGADVALGDLAQPAAARPFLKEITDLGRRADYQKVDVSNAKAVARWFERVSRKLGPPDLIIPNAAIATAKDVATMTPDEWRREIDINLNGAFYMAQAGVKGLLAAKRPGRVVFIGSWVADAPHTYIPAYCAAKAGLRILCRTMALDLAGAGILVNEVAPGYVNAGLSGRMFDQDEALRKRCTKNVPIHLLIEADEVAAQVLHLCDPANRHITGSAIVMDGGLSQTNASYGL